MKKILITGAGSYIGTAFETYMAQFGDEYTVDTVDMIGDSWKDMDFSGYDSIFHVSGIAHSDNGRISKEKAKLYYAVNRDLTVETAKKAKADGVKQFIFMSSAIVYGNSAPIGLGKRITKDTPVNPANCYGDSKVQAENGLRKLEDDSFRVVILRPPMVYGKGSKGNYPLMSRMAQKLPVFPYVRNRISMLYVENLCEFVRLMIKNNERGLFWPQNREYSNTSEMVKMIGEAHGKKVHLIRGFEWALKLLGLFTGIVDKAFGNRYYEKEMSSYKEDYQKFSLKSSVMRTEGGSIKGKKHSPKICLCSASGGHFEQLCRLKPLLEKYDGFTVTEKTDFKSNADYYVTQVGLGEEGLLRKTFSLFREVRKICKKEKPDYVITTGTYISLPFMIYCKLHHKKLIYIETFARVNDTTKAGRFMYRFADLFIYQWEPLKKYYPKGIYGGSIY